MTASGDVSCLTLSSKSISFKEAMAAEGEKGRMKVSVRISEDQTVEMPPSAPEAQWLCDPAEVPLPYWRAPRGIGVGLSNPHALCFMNAVLQALAYTPGLADDCLEERHRLSCYSRQSRVNQKGPPAHGTQQDSGGQSAASISFCAFCKLEQQVLAIHRKGFGTAQKGPLKGPSGWAPNHLASYIRPFVWRAFRPGRQEDAHEFLRFFLDALMKAPATAAAAALQQRQQQQKAKKEVKPEIALTSYFGRLFGSWLRSSVVCEECGKASVRFESAIDIPLDIGGGSFAGHPGSNGRSIRLMGGHRGGLAQKPYSLEKALARFIAKETLSGGNAYMCQRCNKKVTATKQLQLFTTPRVLVFALKRFSLSLSHGFPVPIKCHRPVSFPSKLNLLPYVASDAVKAQQLQLQQQHPQQPKLRLPGRKDDILGSSASTTASSPSSSPPYSPNNSSPVRLAAAAEAAPRSSPEALGSSPSAATSKISGGAPAAACAGASYLYRLYAVVAHSGGSLSSGHYRAFVRAPNAASQQPGQGGDAASWLAIDDEMVSVVSEAAVLCRLQQEAYLLFYAKIPSKAELEHQQQCKQQRQEQLTEHQAAAAAHVDDESELGANSVSSLESDESTSEDEWSDCSSLSESSTSSTVSGDSEASTDLSAVFPLVLQLRKAERGRRSTLSRRRRVLLAFRSRFILQGLRAARLGGRDLLSPSPSPLHPQPRQQRSPKQRREQQQHQQQQPRVISMMTAEMMRERRQAAASRQHQFGCRTASAWADSESKEDAASVEERQFFESMQTLQQPLPKKRSRHDREYDMGKAKKVKDPLRSKPVGAPTLVTTQADSKTAAFVVQQRAAFDALQQRNGNFAAFRKKGNHAKNRRGPHHNGHKVGRWKGKQLR